MVGSIFILTQNETPAKLFSSPPIFARTRIHKRTRIPDGDIHRRPARSAQTLTGLDGWQTGATRGVQSLIQTEHTGVDGDAFQIERIAANWICVTCKVKCDSIWVGINDQCLEIAGNGVTRLWETENFTCVGCKPRQRHRGFGL